MSEELNLNQNPIDVSSFNELEEDQAGWEAAAEQARTIVEAEQAQEDAMKAQATEQAKEQGFIANNPIQAVQEVGSAIVGGGIDAVESVGGLFKLSGDTIQTGINALYGVQDDQNNPFHKDYEGSAVDIIPDQLTPENRSGLGKLTRGLVEFGLLSWATAGTGGATAVGAKAAKLGSYGGRFGKALGLAKPSGKFVTFIGKGKKPLGKLAKITSEGAVADFITQSSEMGNIANLVDEHAPFLPFSEALSIKEDDNPWLARIKTTAAGGVTNIVGHYLIGLVKGMRVAKKAVKAGDTVEQANIKANKELNKTVKEGIKEETITNKERADYEFAQGNGIRDQRDYFDEYLQTHLDEDDYKELQKLFAGKKIRTKIDTRGRGTYYHGTREQFTLDKDYNSLEQGKQVGIYGDGLYTTEDFTTARKYTRKGRKKGDKSKPIVYRGAEKEPVKFIDLDKPMDSDAKAFIEDYINREPQIGPISGEPVYSAFESAVKEAYDNLDDDATLAEFFDEIRHVIDDNNYYEDGVTWDGINEWFIDPFRNRFRELGFGGFTHEGGYKAGKGKRLHQVRIYWDPANQLDLSKADPTAAEIEDYIAFAKKIGASKGDTWDNNLGKSSKQDMLDRFRKPDPTNNPEKFDDSARATTTMDTNVNNAAKNLSEANTYRKVGGRPVSSSNIVTETALREMSNGDKNIRQYILEIVENISEKAFQDIDNAMPYAEVKATIIKQMQEIYGMLAKDDGVDQLKNLFDNPEARNYIHWVHDGNKVVTGTGTQKAALGLVVQTLAKQLSEISAGTLQLPKRVNKQRQIQMILDRMEVALIEHKKIGWMTGNELAVQKGLQMGGAARKRVNRNLTRIESSVKKYRKNLDELAKDTNNPDKLNDLIELYAASDGAINTLEHINDYLQFRFGSLIGGNIQGNRIAPRLYTELTSVYYNSILSSLKTPIRAVLGTNFITVLRPWTAYIGARITGDRKTAAIAAAGIDAIGKAYAEGLQMFIHNYKVGMNRGKQSYVGRFDQAQDIAQLQKQKRLVDKYGTDVQKNTYGFLTTVADFNTNPFVRFSQNVMGAGDAMARTVIGRFEMRMRAAQRGIEQGIDIKDLTEYAARTENDFRSLIFKEKDGKFVISDEAAQLAGNEATLTSALPDSLRIFESLNKVPGGLFFFPFVRTGYNALRLSWAHTPLEIFTKKWTDIMSSKPDFDVLAEYGITKGNLAQEQAIMKGRLAMGTTLIGAATAAAYAGQLYGDLPFDKETRDLWRINGIQPNSIKVSVGGRDVYVSYRDLEPFNTLLAATANLVNYQHVLGTDYRDETAEKLVWMATATFVDKSMLAGVEDLAILLNADSAGGQVQNILTRGLRTLFPGYGLLGQLGDIVDANEKEANTFLENFRKRDLIFKSTIPPKYDILAKDRSGKRYQPPVGSPLWRIFNAFSPVTISAPDGDFVKEGLLEMNFNLPEIMDTYKGVKLTSIEKSELSKYMSMGPLRSRLEAIMGDKNGLWARGLADYKNRGLRQTDFKLYEQKFYRVIAEEFRRAKKLAWEELRRNNPQLDAKFRARTLQKGIGQSGNYEAIQNLINLPK